ncbi:MAG TPA: universal stress protein [Beijerinckiaceae bacterium]|jgi:nucleotide-binding universal stress UspA family protein|nr:universal stress protein [Beijerinckiaceae bacterium]
MKTILVPIELHTAIDSVLATALLLGNSFGAIVEGMSLGPDLPDLVAFDLPVSWTVADQTSWRELVDEGHRRFDSFMAASGVAPLGTAGAAGPTYGWSERSLGDSQLGSYARIFDLSVVGRPGNDRGNPRLTTLEGALFDSGRPVILAPPEPPQKLGETIVIAWTKSIESARTLALAQPFLARANRVFILAITDHGMEDPLVENIVENLCLNGIPASLASRSGKGKTLGEAWLGEAEALGADLLIKGGFTRSRLRHMIFGDATSHIVNNAKMPVMMAA